jgi:UDP-N-acetyl-D-glucosamine dehydrogenase
MPKFVMDKEIRLLGSDLSGKKVCKVGLSYKSGIADLRSSPSLVLWDLLEAAKAQVSYHDLFHPTFHGINCVDLSTSQFELAIVATHHSDPNTSELISSSKFVLDCTATIAGVFWL